MQAIPHDSAPRRVPPASLPFPRTRFLAPAPRPGWVARPRLLRRLRRALDDHRVVLVRAGAGFGKTTLAAQVLTELSGSTVWVACEPGDRDPARFFAALVASLNPGGRGWDLGPGPLVASFASGPTGQAAATAELIERLADLDAPLAWIWDDFHLVGDDTCAWVASFVEILPPGVRCLLLARDAPRLPMARWRARGELDEITEESLRFSGDESRALLQATASAMDDEAGDGAIDQSLVARAGGWAAGLRLLAADRGGRSAVGAPVVQAPGLRHLFDYLAEEVFERLPTALSSFLLDVSVLPEWSPPLCAAVAGTPGQGQPDAQALLLEAARRSLPLRIIDPGGPILRPDDLFRDFLLERLRRDHPARAREVTLRAAAQESDPLRRAQLLADAGDAQAAARALAASIDAVLETTSPGAVRELVERLQQADPDAAPMAYVRGVMAFRRLAFADAARQLERAADDPDPAGAARKIPALVLASRASSYIGRLDDAQRLLDRASALAPHRAQMAELEVERAWLGLAHGRCEVSVNALHSAIALAEEAVSPTLCARMADRMRGSYFGFAGADALFRRFHALVVQVVPGEITLTRAHAQLLRAWAALSEGDFATAHSLLPRVAEACERLGRPHALAVDLSVACALLAAAEGDGARAVQLIEGLLPDAPGLSREAVRLWDAAFVYMLARACWIVGDDKGLAAARARLQALPRLGEWPTMGGLRELVEAYFASRQGDPHRAAMLFERCARRQRDCPIRAASDARVGLACELARLGDREAAWTAFEPAILDSIEEGSIRALLFESHGVLGVLGELVPPDHPRRLECLAGIERAQRLREAGAAAQAWDTPVASAASAAGAASTAAAPNGGAVFRAASPETATAPGPSAAGAPRDAAADLTAREAEVMELVAAGASNKRIALRLDISLHTVKRHVANIIGKLGVQSRGEAAARWVALHRD